MTACSAGGESLHTTCDDEHPERATHQQDDHSPTEHNPSCCDEERCLFVSTAAPVVLHDCGMTGCRDDASDLHVVSLQSVDATPDRRRVDGAKGTSKDRCALTQVWLT